MNDGEANGLVEVKNPDEEIGGHNGKSVQEFAVEPAPVIAISGKRHRDWYETTPVEDCTDKEKKIIDAIDTKFSNGDDRKIPDASFSVAPNATCTNGQVTITRQREEEQELNGGLNANDGQVTITRQREEEQELTGGVNVNAGHVTITRQPEDEQELNGGVNANANANTNAGHVTITTQREEEQEPNGGLNANADQWSPSHLSRVLLSQAWKLDFPPRNRKLLILDVNGLLVARYTKIDRDIIPADAPYGVVSRSYMFKRPFCDSFLAFCFENFDVGFWSSMREANVVRALDFICQGMQAFCRVRGRRTACESRVWQPENGQFNKFDDIRFVMHQGDCTFTGLRNPEKHSQPLFLKELVKVWSKFPQFNESNTLLIDDTPYKALRNPPHTAVFPEAYFYNETDTFLQGPLVEYLTQLRDAGDVREFVRTHPIGMPAIAPGCLYWNVYQQVLETRIENVSPLYSLPPVTVVPQPSPSGWDLAGRVGELEGSFPHAW